MPIDIDQFKAASQPLAERIDQFLSRNPKQAFTMIEIIAEVEAVDPATVPLLIVMSKGDRNGISVRYAAALDDLVKSSLAAVAALGGINYYAHGTQQ